MKLLAISGWKRSGKDYCADYILSNYFGSKASFAAPVKDKVAIDFNLPRSWMDDPQFKEKPILSLPIDPQESYSIYVTEFMFKEFRSADGDTASHFVKERNMGICGHILKKLYHTPRSLCILEGNTKRQADKYYWAKKAVETIAITPGVSILADFRFKSEAECIKNAFGDRVTTLRINRFEVNTSEDPSENDLNDYKFDHVIENKGTLEEFHVKIDQLMKTLL